MKRIDRADHAATRDAKIVRLWNEGIGSAALASRFGCRQGLIQDVVKAARARGEVVRVSPYNTDRRTA